MSKIFLIARRDFLATVSTKGFIIAIMVPPLIYTAIITVFPRLMSNRVPAVSGGLVVIDQAGQVTPGVRRYLEPQAMAARREAAFNRAMGSTPMGGAASSGAGGTVARRAVMGESTTIEITESPAGALEQEKQQLTRDDGVRRLGVLVIHPHAVAPDAEGKLGAYDLFVRRNLDIRIQNEIRNGAADAIVDARVRAAGLDRQRIDALTTVARPASITVTASGESATRPDFGQLLPMGFALLLMISVMSSGQYLLTTTIEEKSSRTMEVILSAVSPFELLTGKILGQMAVGLTILVTYCLDRHSEPGVDGDVGSDRPVAARVSVHLFPDHVCDDGIAHGGDWLVGERAARSAVADDANHSADDDPVAVLVPDLARAQFAVRHGGQLHPADERVCHAAAPDVDVAAADVAGMVVHRGRDHRAPAARCGSRRASSRSAC